MKPNLLNINTMRYITFILALLLFSCTKSGENEDLSSNLSKWNK